MKNYNYSTNIRQIGVMSKKNLFLNGTMRKSATPRMHYQPHDTKLVKFGVLLKNSSKTQKMKLYCYNKDSKQKPKIKKSGCLPQSSFFIAI
jgi:hypothetical protein